MNKRFRHILFFPVLVLIPALFATHAWAGNNIVLLMDNSGSMKKNDPDSWSKSSAEFFINRCQPSDRVSIIPFDSSLRRNKRLKFTDPVKNRRKIIQFIRDMDYKGPWTDFNWALQEAYRELKNQEGYKYVILFTDGEPDPDPKDKLYNTDPKNKAAKNRSLSLKAIERQYIPAGIKLFTIAFTNKSDIDFLMKLSYETNQTYDFCFRVDQSYGISDIFLKISNFIPTLGNWFSSGINIPPSLANSFILVNLNKNISQRKFINQSILDGIDQLALNSKHKKIPVTPYHWPQLAKVRDVKDVVRQLSKVQKFFIVMDFSDNGQTVEYYIYDFSNTRNNLYAHKKITLGILTELCGRIASDFFSALKNFRVRKEIAVPVTVKRLATKKPVVCEVTLVQGKDKSLKYTDAFGHAIFVAYEDEPFKISFASGGVKLGEWGSADYHPGKVFFMTGSYDIALKVMASPYYHDDLDPRNKGLPPKTEVAARVEMEALDIKEQTPCVIKDVPIGLTRLSVVKAMYQIKDKIAIPPGTYLPYTKYINITPNKVNSENNMLDETIMLDKNYLADIEELATAGEIALAQSKARRLINLYKDHPQVFEIFSLISDAYASQGDFNEALYVLAYFQNKYKDKYYYRKPEGLPKDRFLLSLGLARLRLINYLQKPAGMKNNLQDTLGLDDLRAGQRFFNLCQNSIIAAEKIQLKYAREFYLYYALAAYKAHRLSKGKLGAGWPRHYAHYKKMRQQGTGDNLNPPILGELLREVEIAYNRRK